QNGQFSSTLQLLNLIHHPEISLQLIKFISSNVLVLLCGMIGIIGWRDTITPLLYYPAMLLILSIAMIAEFTGSEESGRRSYKLIFTSFAIAAFAIYFIQYLIWSPVGATAIYSIQGRYLIPLVVAVGLGISGHRQNPQVYARLSAIVVTAQMLTCICLPYAIYVRYYSR
ncbi:MAG TPA: DUF2142 domain-containing protein, partial [Terracidiphilus sp.]|nr:DUF2142 domain-containing protein [Terracidiphilus sp.]